MGSQIMCLIEGRTCPEDGPRSQPMISHQVVACAVDQSSADRLGPVSYMR